MTFALLSREKRAGSLSTQAGKQKASPVRVLDTKLKIGPSNDKYEQEADRMADAVVRMPVPGQGPVQGKGGFVELMDFNRRSSATAFVGNSDARLLEGSGQALPKAIRSFFEPRFGRDFSQVRFHADAQAGRSAGFLRARAYTMGNHIAFGAGMYDPQTAFGKRLLAHELTHVVQQNSTDGPPVLRREESPPNFRDCTPAITGVPDPNERLEEGRQRARGYVGAAIRALNSAPAAGSTYATALNRHFVNPTAAQRASIQNTYRQIMNRLGISNFICNSQNICQGEQAFWIAADDLIHVCRPFWSLSTTCKAIILIHEAHHDIAGGGEGVGYRGDPTYPAGNNPPPGGQTTAMRMNTPDAYAFFAAHIWRDTDTSSTCF